MEKIAERKALALPCRITTTDWRATEQCDVPAVTCDHAGQRGLFDGVERMPQRGVGERDGVTLSPGEGFGEHDPGLPFTDDLDNVLPQSREVGAEVEMQNDRGESRLFRVTRIVDGRLTVDGKRPFAGETITFQRTVVDVRNASVEELAGGPRVAH